ncbi:hypothetical protein [Lentzea cavernae]|uniref:Uncharacterized protein n=1 Tax=Lentzea cavernae TaxID=2020703 RepID=A0ABQ3M7U4_9PSEU|nr:hypothetical protein [Lentzea cavernae]GHH35982.1 hypothetical protein GCM10017774_22110 [Lentzea cavernae]
MQTALVLGISGVVLLFLVVFTALVLLGRRARRGRLEGRYTYSAKPNGTYDNSSSSHPGT